MLSQLFLISICIAQSLCCIPCDPRGREAMDKFKILIPSQHLKDVETLLSIKEIAKHDKRLILDYLENEVRMLDKTAISQIVSEYQKTVDVIKATEFKEIKLLDTVETHFIKLKKRIQAIVRNSEKRRCPNKQGTDSCGLMMQTYTNCKTCKEEKVICAGGPPENQEYFDRCSCMCTLDRCFDLKTGFPCTPCQDFTSHLAETIHCGELNINVTEGEDVVLYCDLEWYASLEDSHNNVFTEENDTEPVITTDPYKVIEAVEMNDSGQYECTTVMPNGVPVGQLTYHLTVFKGQDPTMDKDLRYRKLIQMSDNMFPTQPPVFINTDLNVLGLAAAGTLFIICLICGCMCWRTMRRSKEPQENEPV